MCEGKNVYLINNSKRIKPEHVTKGKLHLNKNCLKILSIIFISGISKVFNLQSEWDNAHAVECIFNKTLSAKYMIVMWCWKI